MLVKKRTTLLASHEALVFYFVGLNCDGSHEHQQLAGSGFTADAQVWTWDFASRVISGVTRLRKVLAKADAQRAYPSVAVGGDEESAVEETPAGAPPAWHKCPGGRGRQQADDPRHTREAGV